MTTHDSRRFLLEEALHKANDAVFFDNHQHYEDAIIKYGDSCALLGQVMRTHLEDDDKRKIEAVVSVLVWIDSFLRPLIDSEQRTTYVRRIFELQDYVTPNMHKL